MFQKSIFGVALLAAVMAVAGCQTSLTPDAGQTAPAAPAGPMGRGGAGGGRGGGAAAPAGLGQAMGEMGRMLTAIKAEAADPEKAEQAIKDISTFARDVAISKLQTPPNVNRMATAEEKAKAMSSFRTQMNGLTRTLLDLEDAVNAKKPDDIKKAIEKLDQMEAAGHKEFQVNAGRGR
jgi:cytochrome c556